MTTVVFGGGGFIGREILHRLADDSADLVCADIRWPETLPDLATCVECDVTDGERVADVLGTHDATRVVHLAYLLTAETTANPRYATAVNGLGTANVLQAAADQGVERVLYASSIATYGDPTYYDGTVTEDVEVPAVFSRFPVTLYSAMKQLNEYQGRLYDADHDMTVAGVRPGVVFGPGRSSGLAGWASSFVTDPARGGTGHIPLPADQAMSMVYRDDVAELFVRLHDAPTIAHDVYNTGGHHMTVREVADRIEAEFDGSITWEETGDPLGLVPDVSHERARRELGYELTPFDEAIRHHASVAGNTEA